MNRTISRAPRIFAAGIAAAVCAAAPLLVSSAYAQARHEMREHERFRTPHWVYDDRYHHNHYYPSVGYSVQVLPAGHLVIGFRGGRYFFHGGVWFQQGGPGYLVARPPVGIVVPVLPPAYTTVWVAGIPYYYANDIYYASAQGGYAVAAPPMEAAQAPMQAPPPPAPAPQAGPTPVAPVQSAPGNWYYCESAKGYYPYVTECKEGWRTVPAAPPQMR
ncbi:MAG: hypothetical protein HY017_00415 [Betaproteobacteria bacterium]|nr:hypothetical protein [Betaproteobacteria bacterium]